MQVLQRRAPFNEYSTSDWDALIATNLSSLFYVSRALTPAMSERGSGKVINIGSVQSKLAREPSPPIRQPKVGLFYSLRVWLLTLLASTFR